MEKQRYPSDVTDDEWAFIAPYLTLMKEEAPQREYSLCEVFNGMRWIVRAGAPWRFTLKVRSALPTDLPPWYTVYQQSQRWIRALLRLAKGRKETPSAAIFDSRTLQSTVESGSRAGYDGAKRKKGSKTHVAVDTLGHLLALHITPANEQDRAQVGELAPTGARSHWKFDRGRLCRSRLYRR